MNIDDLEIFMDVAHRGSFAAVAKERDVAPSSISRVIANIEANLGIRLFQRTTRKVSLTEAGQSYFTKIQPLVSGLNQAAEELRQTDQQPKGTIHLTSSVAFGENKIIPLLKEFMDTYNEISIRYTLTDQQINIVENQIDLAIRHGILADSSLIASQLLKVRYKIVASPKYLAKNGHPKMPKDIIGHTVLLLNIPHFRTQWNFKNAQGEIFEIALESRYKISNVNALRQLTRQGAGISLLADWLVEEDIKTGNLIELFSDQSISATDFDTAVWLVMPSREYQPLKVRCLVDFLKQKFTFAGSIT